ncbi:MAG: hypothetical protein QM538_01605 [Methylacidiphilales bacterium]|nr:hypothetical protein [Candidatus Methylacidiphilales bacterium]
MESFPKVFNPTNYAIITVTGKDSGSFLFKLIAGNTPNLDLQVAFVVFLNHQGRIFNFGHIIKINSEEYRLLIPYDTLELFVSYLNKMKFRSHVSITSTKANILILNEQEASIHQVATSKDNEVEIRDYGLLFTFGMNIGHCILFNNEKEFSLWLADQKLAEFINTTVAFNAWCIYNSFPVFSTEMINTFLALRILPEEIKNKAISLKKGCYPGQEIIARTTYLGSNKYSLITLASKNLIDSNLDILINSVNFKETDYILVARKIKELDS